MRTTDAALHYEDAVASALQLRRGAITVGTQGAGFVDITAAVADWLKGAQAEEGMLTLFIRHTSASLTIQENTDPDVQADLLDALDRLAPQSETYRHNLEGPDDMPAHIKALLASISLSVPVVGGRLGLGTWQAAYLVEHRQAPHRRDISLIFLGTTKI